MQVGIQTVLVRQNGVERGCRLDVVAAIAHVPVASATVDLAVNERGWISLFTCLRNCLLHWQCIEPGFFCFFDLWTDSTKMTLPSYDGRLLRTRPRGTGGT